MLKFGIFDHLEARHGVPLAELYEDRLKLIEQADNSGFYSWMVAEHHHSPLCMAPNQMVFLAAAAARTRNIKLGSMVSVLPLHHPIRLIEDVCMLDNLSRGRAQIGVGKGALGTESKMWNDDPLDRQGMFEESLRIVLQGFQNDFVSVDGRRHKFADLWMALRPQQSPHPPFWYGENGLTAGRHRMNLLCNGPTTELAGKVSAYLEAFRKARPSWQDGVCHNEMPLYGATRRIYITPTVQEAMERARDSYEVYRANFRKPLPSDIVKDGRRFPEKPVQYVGPPAITFERATAGELLMIGTPSTVRDHLRDYMRNANANYYSVAFQWGDLSYSEASRSMQLFYDEVMPIADEIPVPTYSFS